MSKSRVFSALDIVVREQEATEDRPPLKICFILRPGMVACSLWLPSKLLFSLFGSGDDYSSQNVSGVVVEI